MAPEVLHIVPPHAACHQIRRSIQVHRGSLAALDLQLAFLGSLILLGKLGTWKSLAFAGAAHLELLEILLDGFPLQSSRHNVPRPLG